MSVKIEFTSYDNDIKGLADVQCDNIKSVSVSYDGGRLSVYVNGEDAFRTTLAGNDCNVSIELKE